MKRSIILSLVIAFIAAPASGFKQEDLDKLKATNSCEKCKLIGADLRKANLNNAKLKGAKLEGANLWQPDLNRANLEGATFCKTIMPDGSVNNADC